MSLTLGERLAQIRAERRMSLHEISRGTRIQIKYLQYLESGEYDKLPAQVYVKGFLRSYANFMGVSESPLIRSYERERGIQYNIKKERNPENEQEAKKPFSIHTFAITPKVITLAGIIFLIVGGFFYLYTELDNFISTPMLIVSSPIDNETTSGSQIYIIGRSDKDGRIFINEQSVVVNDEGEFNESISLQEGLNIITIRAINRFEKETVKTLSIHSNYKNPEFFAQNSDSDNSNENEVLEKAEKIELEVGAKNESVWVSIEADGKLVFSGILQPGSWHKISAQTEAVVSSGKGNETMIRINGRDEGLLGEDAGSVKDSIFTLSAINGNN